MLLMTLVVLIRAYKKGSDSLIETVKRFKTFKHMNPPLVFKCKSPLWGQERFPDTLKFCHFPTTLMNLRYIGERGIVEVSLSS
jgi:hypothetical protein